MFLGGAGLLLWPFLMRKGIELPFKRTGSITFKTAEQVDRERIERLRRLDSDNDNLNDYDEQYLFRTSPYVTDTDSDGIDDGTEVAQESNPNCPRGGDCRQASLEGSGAGTGSGGVPAEPLEAPQPDEARINAAITLRFGDPNLLTPEIIKTGLEKMSITDLRSFLGDLGIPPAALQRADDMTLRRLVEDTLTEIASQNAAANADAAAANGQTGTDGQ